MSGEADPGTGYRRVACKRPLPMPAQQGLQGRRAAAAAGDVTLDVSAGLAHRRLASSRCPPLEDGRRDPLDPDPGCVRLAHAVFGLNRRELSAETERLERAGWRPWELRARLGLARRVGGRL